MRFRVRLRGSGTVDIAAYGIGDAEHRVEKEITAALSDARVEIREVRRLTANSRIVEEFRLSYAVTTTLDVDAPNDSDARRQAFAAGRRALGETRFARIAWDKAELVR